ncbi:MAG: FAD binding domain-containing protein [Pseudomonadota bacterium]
MSYYRPDTLTDALQIIAKGTGQVIAGGTDVYPAGKPGQGPAWYLDVTNVAELRGITLADEGVLIGAAVTWSELIAADLPPAFDALKAAGREVGSVQIQNAGTLAGNLCNASPAADGVPALLALDASVDLASTSRGVRRVALAEFITGVRRTDLGADEIVTGIHIPPVPGSMTSAFGKLGSRRYLVISICMTAVNLDLDARGVIRDARIAVGACSAVAQRLTQLEQEIIGKRPQEVVLTDAHLSVLSPIDDVRGSAAYRLEAAREQVARVLHEAAG